MGVQSSRIHILLISALQGCIDETILAKEVQDHGDMSNHTLVAAQTVDNNVYTNAQLLHFLKSASLHLTKLMNKFIYIFCSKISPQQPPKVLQMQTTTLRDHKIQSQTA
jgi:hypothetical protein